MRTPLTRYGDDQPETHERRLWKDLRDLSDRLAHTIPKVAPSCPVLVSGEWGTGKSSVLKVTERKLADRGHPTVWFGAWYHEGEGSLLPLLLRALWLAAPKRYRRVWNRRLWWQLKRAGLMVAKKIPNLLVSGATEVKTLGAWGLLAELVPRHRALDFWDEDPVQDLWAKFSRLLSEAWPHDPNHKLPIIIFIDDLDRCSPAASLALIDSLRLLLGNLDNRGKLEAEPNCRFVISLDRETLAQAVSAKFQGLGNDHASRYLEKIFPISFQLPQPRDEAIMEFVESFLEGTPQEDPAVLYKDVLGLALSDMAFANPRLMKRCVERFRMIKRFESPTTLMGNRLHWGPDKPQPGSSAEEPLKGMPFLADKLSFWVSEKIDSLRNFGSRDKQVPTASGGISKGENLNEKVPAPPTQQMTQPRDQMGSEVIAVPRRKNSGASPDEYRELTLAKWIAASERWPTLRQLLARRGDEYWRQVQQVLNDGVSTDLPADEIRMLKENPELKLWLRRELLGGKGTRLREFRDADRRLRDWGM